MTSISEGTYNYLQPLPELKSTDTVLTSTGGSLNCTGKLITESALKDKSFEFSVHLIKASKINNPLGHSVEAIMGLVRKL